MLRPPVVTLRDNVPLQLYRGCWACSRLDPHFTPLVDAADLDGAALTVDDPFSGATIDHGQIRLPMEPGLGVKKK